MEALWHCLILWVNSSISGIRRLCQSPANLLSLRAGSRRCLYGWTWDLSHVEAEEGCVCECLERRENIKGVVICNFRCIVLCNEGQLLEFATSLSLWSFLTCISFLPTPDTFPRKLQHPPTAPGQVWPSLGSPVTCSPFSHPWCCARSQPALSCVLLLCPFCWN